MANCSNPTIERCQTRCPAVPLTTRGSRQRPNPGWTQMLMHACFNQRPMLVPVQQKPMHAPSGQRHCALAVASAAAVCGHVPDCDRRRRSGLRQATPSASRRLFFAAPNPRLPAASHAPGVRQAAIAQLRGSYVMPARHGSAGGGGRTVMLPGSRGIWPAM